MTRHNKKLSKIISFSLIQTMLFLQAYPVFAGHGTVIEQDNIHSIDTTTPGYTEVKTVVDDYAKARIKTDNFNLAPGEVYDINYQGQHQSFHMQVVGNNVSTIAGTMNATGVGAATSKTILTNSNGIIFCNGATINANAFFASTLNLTNIDLDKVEFKSDSGKYGEIVVDNATFNVNKDLVFVSNKAIFLNNSNINTGSTARFVTTDGISFELKDGEINSEKKVKYTKETANIIVDNTTINSGKDIKFIAKGRSSSDTNVIIQGNSLVKAADGTIYITAVNGKGQFYGNIEIAEGSGQTTLLTSKNLNLNAEGDLKFNKLNATGNINLVANEIITAGKNSNIIAGKNVSIQSKSQDIAVNNVSPSGKRSSVKFEGDSGDFIFDITNEGSLKLVTSNKNNLSVNDDIVKSGSVDFRAGTIKLNNDITSSNTVNLITQNLISNNAEVKSKNFYLKADKNDIDLSSYDSSTNTLTLAVGSPSNTLLLKNTGNVKLENSASNSINIPVQIDKNAPYKLLSGNVNFAGDAKLNTSKKVSVVDKQGDVNVIPYSESGISTYEDEFGNKSVVDVDNLADKLNTEKFGTGEFELTTFNGDIKVYQPLSADKAVNSKYTAQQQHTVSKLNKVIAEDKAPVDPELIPSKPIDVDIVEYINESTSQNILAQINKPVGSGLNLSSFAGAASDEGYINEGKDKFIGILDKNKNQSEFEYYEILEMLPSSL